MSEGAISDFFGSYQTIGDIVRYLPDNDTTTVKRSNVLFAPANSTVAVHISGTATVVIKSSPFGDSTKDFTLATLTATGQQVVVSANYIVVDVTAISGTVTAVLIPNED